MSSLIEAIEKEVLSKAREEADRTVREARRRAEEIIRQAREEAEKILEEAKRKAAEAKRRRLMHETYKARLKGMTRIVEVKSNFIDEVIRRARRKLARLVLDEEAYASVLANLILKAARVIGEEELVVMLNPRDNKRWKSLGRLVEKEMEKRGVEIRIVLGDTINIMGGVIVSSKDGRILCNFSFDAGLHHARTELLGEISRILWRGEP